jgi:hypothetical protein
VTPDESLTAFRHCVRDAVRNARESGRVDYVDPGPLSDPAAPVRLCSATVAPDFDVAVAPDPGLPTTAPYGAVSALHPASVLFAAYAAVNRAASLGTGCTLHASVAGDKLHVALVPPPGKGDLT